jgi:LuxR family maltose regulon positive regulatory protein
MATLLRKMKVEDGKIKEYIHKLLAAFSDKEFHPFGSAQDKPSALRLRSGQALSPQPLIEPLSDREIEILQLIAEGQTNQEIASRLYLSLNTVKVHTRNIYGKLGVNNRMQAVARARDLGVLPST